jgi:hypothetical protein
MRKSGWFTLTGLPGLVCGGFPGAAHCVLCPRLSLGQAFGLWEVARRQSAAPFHRSRQSGNTFEPVKELFRNFGSIGDPEDGFS